MAHDVFISYASENKVMADAVCGTLESRSIRCWIAPRDVTPGMTYADTIVEAVTSCQIVVVLLSSESIASAHVATELERALHNGKPILPVRIEDVQPTGSLEYYLAGKHWLDALTPPMEEHMEKVAVAVGRLLGRETKGEPAPAPEPAPPPKPSGFQASRTFAEARALEGAGQYAQATPVYRRALEMYELLDDKTGVALCANNMAACMQPDRDPAGSWDDAIASYHRALALREEMDDKGEQIIVLGNLAYCLSPDNNPQGAWQESGGFQRRKATLAAEINDKTNEAKALVDAGWATMPVRNPQGDWAEATELYTRGATLYEELGDALNHGIALHNLGYTRIRGELGNLTEETRQVFRRAAEILRQAGDIKTAEAAESFANFIGSDENPIYAQACTAFNAKRWAEAIPLFAQAAETFAKEDKLSQQASSLHNQAWCMDPTRNDAGDWNACAALYRQAAELRQSLGEDRDLSNTLSNLGWLLAMGTNPFRDPVEGVRALEQAVELKRKTGDTVGEGICLNNLALAFQPTSNPEGSWDKAIETFQAALALQEGVDNAITAKNLAECFLPTNNPGGDWQQAGEYYRQASELFRGVNQLKNSGECLHQTAYCLIRGDGANMTEETWNMFHLAAQLKRQAGDLAGAKISESWLH